MSDWFPTRRVWLEDGLLVTVCAGAPILEFFIHPHGHTAIMITVIVAGAGSLLLRRRFPVSVLVVCCCLALVGATVGNRSPLIGLSFGAALYSIGASEPRIRFLAGVTLPICGVFVVGLLLGSDRAPSIHDCGHAVMVVTPVVVGSLVRLNRDTTALRIERAELAVRAERDAQRLRIEQERQRIARDLHDAVGHALTTITVQAGVAGRLLDTRPEFAREALAEISAASGEALRDLRGVVGMLRGSDGADDSTGPEPCLDDLVVLVDRARGVGVDTTLTVTGPASQVPRSAQVAVYRMVQESLTNIRKHAGAVSATVEVTVDRDEVQVRVWNALTGQPGPAGRHQSAEAARPAPLTGAGLVGMRERATMLGGTLDAGHAPDGGFEARIRIPLPVVDSLRSPA
ncbi:MAG: sensor histidine kinase [Micromonosporaceae bacterium]|nr:sensor histidine kinase [Micromonosporaceae bacterium]